MWKIAKPVYGDHIRVSRGLYTHHGIYASDDCIYQFSAPDGADVDPENAIINVTTLEGFLKGGTLEVRQFSEQELENKRTPEQIVECARNSLGEGGYDLITNNCEHFANKCVFGKATSAQVEDIFELIMGVLK